MAKQLTPEAAIQRHCLECCGETRLEVEFCTCPTCPLYPYRFGREPEATDYQYQPGDENIEAKDMAAKAPR